MDTTEYLRNASNSIRDGFASIVDNTLGKLGLVGKFLGGMAKRAFDLGLMLTPLGYAVFEEEATGTLAMYGMGVDAMYNPYRDRYERLGNVISAIPEYLAHASAAEWGSIAVDALPDLIAGGAGISRTLGRFGAGIIRNMEGRLIHSLSNLSKGSFSPLQPERFLPKYPGSGPAKGFLEVSDFYKSSKAVQNFGSPKEKDFIFDLKTQRFIIGESKLKHDGILNAGGVARHSEIVGGRIYRSDGQLITDEWSGHYGGNWTPEIRENFKRFMDHHGVKVYHKTWGKP